MASHDSRVEGLIDRAAIADTMADFALGLGIPDFDRYTACFDDDVEVSIPHHLGVEVARMSGEEFGRSIEDFQGKFEARFHLQGAQHITVDGDRAHLTSLQMFRFVLPTDHGSSWYMGGGVLDIDLIRRPAGWKITRLANQVTWDDGNWSIFEHARGPVGRD